MPKKKPARLKTERKPLHRKLSAAPPPAAKKSHVTFGASGHLTVHGPKGERIQELEKPWPVLWAEHAESLGVDPAGYVFQLPGDHQPVKLVRQLDGITWKLGK